MTRRFEVTLGFDPVFLYAPRHCSIKLPVSSTDRFPIGPNRDCFVEILYGILHRSGLPKQVAAIDQRRH